MQLFYERNRDNLMRFACVRRNILKRVLKTHVYASWEREKKIYAYIERIHVQHNYTISLKTREKKVGFKIIIKPSVKPVNTRIKYY